MLVNHDAVIPGWTSEFSSVQFKVVCMRSEKPICTQPRLIDDDPLSSFQGRSFNASLFPRLSPPSVRWCDVLGFVPAGNVSSSSTRKIFRDPSHDGCFAQQYICSVISFNFGMSRAVHPQTFSKADVEQRQVPVWASHSTVHFLWQAQDDGIKLCVLTVTF